MSSAPQPPSACPPLTAQQSLLCNQHAGKGKGLLIVALEPLVHHLRAGPDCRLQEALGQVCGWGGGPTAVFTTSRMPSIQEDVTLNGHSLAPAPGSETHVYNLELSTFPWSNTLCTWLLNCPPAPAAQRMSCGWTLCPSEQRPVWVRRSRFWGPYLSVSPAQPPERPPLQGPDLCPRPDLHWRESAQWVHVTTWIWRSVPPGPDLGPTVPLPARIGSCFSFLPQ